MGLLKLPLTVGDFVVTLIKLTVAHYHFHTVAAPHHYHISYLQLQSKKKYRCAGGGAQDVLNLKLKDDFYPMV